jgi:hypothetical protein
VNILAGEAEVGGCSSVPSRNGGVTTTSRPDHFASLILVGQPLICHCFQFDSVSLAAPAGDSVWRDLAGFLDSVPRSCATNDSGATSAHVVRAGTLTTHLSPRARRGPQ